MSDYPHIKPEEVKVNSWSNIPKGSWSTFACEGIQLIHLPTGIVVEVDSERGQYRNRHLAMVELSRLLEGRSAEGCAEEERF